MQIFESGQLIYFDNGIAQIEECLKNTGTQYYRVIYNKNKKILKWVTIDNYKSNIIYEDTKTLYRQMNISNMFVTPEDFTGLTEEGFAYIVSDIPNDYTSYKDIISKNNNVVKYNILVLAALNLSKAMMSLSYEGLVKYGFNSFYLILNNGCILIPDDDNLLIVPVGSKLMWYDNPKDTAPEVFFQKCWINIATDLF